MVDLKKEGENMANNKLKITLFLTLIVFLKGYICSDIGSYEGNKIFIKSNDKITVIHWHDWNRGTTTKRWSMYISDQNPFKKANNFSYIACVDNKTHDVLFKKPVPALTYLFISDDSKYIIGLSNIKELNPVHLVVFDNFGKLVFYASISADEVKMNLNEYAVFKSKYPKDANRLSRLKLVYRINDLIYFNYGTMALLSKKARVYLYDWSGPSHLSKNFAESETNFIDWYKEPDPEIKLKYTNGIPTAISLLDPAGERFEIEIKGS